MNADLFDNAHSAEARAFHNDNPEVMELFSRFTFQLINAGRRHGGAKMVWERIRWETALSYVDREYKINNNWCPWYAREWMLLHPEHDGFFRTRRLAA